jgi:hypothetical protein
MKMLFRYEKLNKIKIDLKLFIYLIFIFTIMCQTEYYEHLIDHPYTSTQITQHPSIPIDGDIYDDLGRNYSAYLRLQHIIQWTTVYYNNNNNNYNNNNNNYNYNNNKNKNKNKINHIL